uniref:Uncharacterized protein n=1 Tax=Sphaerodactylus townsendi TaxID=933632 RepID=A0ACB8E6R8_9SAUR
MESERNLSMERKRDWGQLRPTHSMAGPKGDQPISSDSGPDSNDGAHGWDPPPGPRPEDIFTPAPDCGLETPLGLPAGTAWATPQGAGTRGWDRRDPLSGGEPSENASGPAITGDYNSNVDGTEKQRGETRREMSCSRNETR